MLAEAGYWLLPKPADVNYLLQESLQSRGFFAQGSMWNAAVRQAFSPLALLLTSMTFILVTLTLAGRRLIKTDY
jgi:hypothetical protein